MRPSERDRQIVEAYLRAMQMGPRGEDGLVELFTDDGEYVESLTVSRPRTHKFKQAIREALHGGLSWNPPDLHVSLDRLEVEATELVVASTATRCGTDALRGFESPKRRPVTSRDASPLQPTPRSGFAS